MDPLYKKEFIGQPRESPSDPRAWFFLDKPSSMQLGYFYLACLFFFFLSFLLFFLIIMWGFIQINSQHDSIKTIPTLNDRIFFKKRLENPT